VVLFSPEIYIELTVDAGLARAEYESDLCIAVERLTLA
jgi:hypothetical protein